MISDLFPNLEPIQSQPAADAGRSIGGSSGARKHRITAERPMTPGAPGVGSARQTALKGTIIDHARRQVAREILALLGKDVPCAPRFRKYLSKLPLTDLVNRRHQLQEENQRELKLEGVES